MSVWIPAVHAGTTTSRHVRMLEPAALLSQVGPQDPDGLNDLNVFNQAFQLLTDGKDFA